MRTTGLCPVSPTDQRRAIRNARHSDQDALAELRSRRDGNSKAIGRIFRDCDLIFRPVVSHKDSGVSSARIIPECILKADSIIHSYLA